MKRFFKMASIILAVKLFVIAVIGISFLSLAPQLGGKIEGKRLEAVERSRNYSDGVFVNPVETNMEMGFKGYVRMAKNFLSDEKGRTPEQPLPVLDINPAQFNTPQQATVITWFGHSAFLVEIDGKRLLLDPMLSEVASPVSFIGPKRFNEKLPLSIADMPEIDAVLISHDHYDHLDYASIKELQAKVKHFFVPLGVGAHLEAWDVPAEKITELDWWHEATFLGMTFVSTPARHFSGRSLNDRMSTLWTSWVILGKNNRLFFSGDTGYFDGFKEIGEKYGPFDLTMMECGQYNELWANIHMMPEQTVQAHLDLKGKLLIPIHWGAFALALHPWTEPAERVSAEAQRLGVPLTTPRIGEPVVLNRTYPTAPWWRMEQHQQ